MQEMQKKRPKRNIILRHKSYFCHLAVAAAEENRMCKSCMTWEQCKHKTTNIVTAENIKRQRKRLIMQFFARLFAKFLHFSHKVYWNLKHNFRWWLFCALHSTACMLLPTYACVCVVSCVCFPLTLIKHNRVDSIIKFQ